MKSTIFSSKKKISDAATIFDFVSNITHEGEVWAGQEQAPPQCHIYEQSMGGIKIKQWLKVA